MSKVRVAVLGATGTVGQRLIQLLDGHPWFEVTALAASDNSSGKRYDRVVRWQLDTPIPKPVAELTVEPCRTGLPCDIALSGLPTSVANEYEVELAKSGVPVISNAGSHRMGEDVPLLVPEINPDHLAALKTQRSKFGGKGFIVTNPNCSALGLVFPLAALQRNFGLEAVQVVTMQAISGAGYPGVASLDILDNVIPSIPGEEEKVETEPLKILGTWTDGAFRFAPFKISALTHRVNVRDGHLEAVSVKLRGAASVDQVTAALSNFTSPIDALDLPSAPKPAMEVERSMDRPQPRLDRDRGRGMTIVVGPVMPCPVLDFKFRVLSHNTIRGAAGAAVLNAELLLKQGFLS